MPPKKAASASQATAAHPSYRDMIKDAIVNLKERNGSSRQALKKYVQNNNNINLASQNTFDALFNRAIKTGVEKGEFIQPKGPSGPVKLVKKGAAEPKPAAKLAAEKKTTTKAAPKAAPKAATKTVTKKTTTKKAPAKATTTKKAAATKKATAAKPKANITKQRKAPPAPAVVERPTVLGKTKSGRITKSTAPPPAASKKTATRKRRSTRA